MERGVGLCVLSTIQWSVKRRGGVSQEEGWGQSLTICCVVDCPLVGHE